MSNKHLTAKNESDVMSLVQNATAKQVWQSEAAQFGQVRASRNLAAKYNVSISAVKAASYYW